MMPNIGLMAKTGLSSAITFHGHAKSIVSSGLQKSIRRKDYSYAHYWLRDWLLFHNFSSIEKQRSKAMLTNLDNRLTQIVPFEDVLAFAQPALILAIRDASARWNKEGRTIAAGRHMKQVVDWLLEARKSRMASDIRAYYDHAVNGAIKLRDRPAAIKEADLPGLRCSTRGDGTLVKELTASWLYHLRRGSYDAFWFAFELMNKVDATHKNKHCGGKTGEYLMWAELLRAYCDKSMHPVAHTFAQHCLALYSSDKLRKERFQYVVHAMLLYIHRDNKDICYDQSKYEQECTVDEFEVAMGSHMVDGARTVPDYVIDMHTEQGRAAGMTRVDFANEGSVVLDEDKQYHVAAMRAIYTQIKLIPVAKPAPAAKKKKATKRKSADASLSDVDESDEFDAKKSKPVYSDTVLDDERMEKFYDDEPLMVSVKRVVKHSMLAQLPCGAKPPTWLSWDGAHSYFVRKYSIKWHIDPVYLDSIKAKFGMISANSVVFKGYLRADDLSASSKTGVYPSRINKGVRVLDKEKCGLIPMSKMTMTDYMYSLLWYILAWRFIIGTADTNSVNIVYSVAMRNFVSVDEISAPGDIDAQQSRPGVNCLWAQKCSAATAEGLKQAYDATSLGNTLVHWRRTVEHLVTKKKGEVGYAESPRNKQLLVHMQANISLLQQRIMTNTMV